MDGVRERDASEKDASGNQQRFWAKVNKGRGQRIKGVAHIELMTSTAKYFRREKRL